MLVPAPRLASLVMFLPRIHSKLIALLLVVGTLYLVTLGWGTPKVPSTFSNPFNKQDATSKPSTPKTDTGQKAPVPPPNAPQRPYEEKEPTRSDARPEVTLGVKPPIDSSVKAQEAKASSKAKSASAELPSASPKEPGSPHPAASASVPSEPAKTAHQSTIFNITWTATTKDGQISFWKEFAPLLASGAPACPPPEREGRAVEAQPFPQDAKERPNVLMMPDGDVTKMQKAHEIFVNGLHGKAAELVYTPGTRGLVTTAGGTYLPVFAVSLRMLRRMGTHLPMEVFLADPNEYESYICDHVFPKLNAKCVILSEILDAAPHEIKISHYQYKVFAMIFSSFEEVMFLDSDAFPVHDADSLFTTKPFTNNGLVTWPDYWESSASPLYYKIAGQPVPSLSIRQSTESGELLLNKKTHSKSLLLATYYNYYGEHYYTLFSQGAAGEGDKETFIAAAYALNETFYQVVEPVRAIGHATSKGWMGSAMVQFDPNQDYGLTEKNFYRNKDKDAAGPIRPFFLHVNVPRLNPAKIFDHEEHTKNVKGEQQRIWQGEAVIKAMFNRDIEKDLWEEVRWVGCALEHKFETWKSKDGTCDKASKHYEGVFGKSEQQPNWAEEVPSLAKDDVSHPFGSSSKTS